MAGRRRLITMARRRHTPEQIIRKLREADRLLGEGADIADVARHMEVSEQTYHRWRNQFGAMKADDARRLKDLERENARLKRIVADKELEIDALREISRDAVLALVAAIAPAGRRGALLSCETPVANGRSRWLGPTTSTTRVFRCHVAPGWTTTAD
jgi:transposase-like protein